VPEVSERTPMSWSFLKHCFATWYWYFFVVLWILAGETESFSTNALLQLYMRSHPTNTYTVAQNNNYPTGVPAVGIVSTLFWATLTDYMGGKRYLGVITDYASCLVLTACSRLLDWFNRCHHFFPDPRVSREYGSSFCNVLLGRQRVRMPSDFLRMGE
jgi:hypothetical protein